MRKKDWDSIQRKIDDGIYKLVRLVRIHQDEVIVEVPFNKVNSNPTERLKYIRSKSDQLTPGEYRVQCRLSNTNGNIVDEFPWTIKPQTLLVHPDDVSDHTHTQTTMNDVDFDDYVRLIKENAQLQATNTYLINELEFFKKEYYSIRDRAVPSLADGGETVKTTTEVITSAVGDSFAALLPIADKYFGLQEKKLELEEKKLSSGKTKVIKKMPKNTIEQRAEKLAVELEELEQNDPDEFDARLDELETANPELYEMVCTILGIEEEEEEEEEGGEDE